MSAKKPTPAQQRERRAKILAIVLGVVFVGVLAIQIPRVLKTLRKGDSVTAAPVVATTPSSASLAVAPATAQLTRLGRFASKDPFRQQLETSAAAAKPAAAPAAKPAAAPAAKPAAAPAVRPLPAPAPTAPVTASAPPTTSVTFTSKPPKTNPLARHGILLLLDGRRQGLLRDDLFPVANPTFRLVQFTPKAAWIQLLGGTLDGGGQTLQLKPGHRVVLRNASTAEQFVLEYVRPALVVPRPAAVAHK